MERLYQEYKDIADFRLVYIKEAHAADSSWPVPYAKDMGITNHTNMAERCEVAQKLLSDKKLTIPTIVDGLDDRVNKAYHAWPDRIFLVRKDGRLAVAAERGPFGFAPALQEVAQWLEQYRAGGEEPPLPETAVPIDYGLTPERELRGDWNMVLTAGDEEMRGVLHIERSYGTLSGHATIEGDDDEATLDEAHLDLDVLTMKVTAPDGSVYRFKGYLHGPDMFSGVWTSEDGSERIECVARRRK